MECVERTVALVFAALAATACGSSASTALPTTSEPPTPAASLPADSTPTTNANLPRADGCDTVVYPGRRGLGVATFETLVPSAARLESSLAADQTSVCPGAMVRFTVTERNTSNSPVEVTPRLVITTVFPHLELKVADPIEVPPAGTASTDLAVTIPFLAPGKYEVFEASAAHFSTVTLDVNSPDHWMPRVFAPPAVPPTSTPATGMGALIRGSLHYDRDHECFQLVLADTNQRTAVVWPAGTTAASTGIGVTLSDGRTFREDDAVSGGGGYLQVSDQWDIPAECSQELGGDIAVFNAAFPLDP